MTINCSATPKISARFLLKMSAKSRNVSVMPIPSIIVIKSGTIRVLAA